MSPDKKDRPLLKEWLGFLRIVFNPPVVILFIVTLILGYQLTQQTDPAIVTVLTLIVSLLSGILGGVLDRKWSNLTGEQIIAARGNIAVRGLKLLLNGLVSLENRLLEYRERHINQCRKEGQNPELVRTYLEDAVERAKILQEETLSSIENWTDMVPGADIRTLIGVLTDLKQRAAEQSAEVGRLQEKLSETEGQSRSDQESLAEQLKAKEDELRETQRELRQAQRQSLTEGTVGLAITGSPYNGLSAPYMTTLSEPGNSITIAIKCERCGRMFDPSSVSGPSGANICPMCLSRPDLSRWH